MILLLGACAVAGCRNDVGRLLPGEAEDVTPFARFAEPHDCVLPRPGGYGTQRDPERGPGPFPFRPVRD